MVERRRAARARARARARAQLIDLREMFFDGRARLPRAGRVRIARPERDADGQRRACSSPASRVFSARFAAMFSPASRACEASESAPAAAALAGARNMSLVLSRTRLSSAFSGELGPDSFAAIALAS